MATLRLSVTSRDALAAAQAAELDGGTLELWSGDWSRVLAVFQLTDPAASHVANGAFDLTPPPETAALASDAVVWARFKRRDGVAAFDCDVSEESGDGALTMATVEVREGAPVRLTAFTYEIPAE